MARKLALVAIALTIAGSAAYAEYGRSATLIDIPTALVLPKGVLRPILSGSYAFYRNDLDPRHDPTRHMEIALTYGLLKNLELSYSLYDIPTGAMALGATYQFLQPTDKRPALAVGVHELNWKRHVSAVGAGYNADGTPRGYEDEAGYALYGLCPTENFSLFFVASYTMLDWARLHVGLGRGKYVGYDLRSGVCNTDYWFWALGRSMSDRIAAPKHDWAIGIFGGFELRYYDYAALIFEFDGRDINLGLRGYYRNFTANLGMDKLEGLWWGTPPVPRVIGSIAYDFSRAPVATGSIAGQVFDLKDNSPVVGTVTVVGIGLSTTSDKGGQYYLASVPATKVRLLAEAPGYTPREFAFTVLAGRRMLANLGLQRSAPPPPTPPPPPAPAVLSGTVRDDETKFPLSGTVTIVESGKTIPANPSTGIYEFTDVPAGRYTVRASALGRVDLSVQVDLPAGETVTRNFDLKKFQTVFYFETAEHLLEPRYDAPLGEVVKMMTARPKLRVEIQGHTDAIGTDEYNMKLSQRRAGAVRDWLIQHGISPDRIRAAGYGERRPVGDNESVSGRRMNRRVDLLILGEE